MARLTSESVQGQVIIPYDSDYYLQVDLDYLYLPGEGANSGRSALSGTGCRCR